MAQNNGNEAAMGFALVCVVFAFAAMFVFAVLAFVALVFTVLAVMAWNKPVTIGKNTITPEEAHAFVWRGIAGAVVLPVFAVFAALLFDLQIDPDLWFYLIVGGYTLGSVGLGILEAEEQEKQAKAAASAQYDLPPQKITAPARPMVPSSERQEPEPFRFATWDDEEERP